MGYPNLLYSYPNLGSPVLKLTLLWTIVLLTSLVLVKLTKIGPIIYTISLERGWGIHTGDLLVIPILLIGVIGTVILRRSA
jgi:hypothetical protein